MCLFAATEMRKINNTRFKTPRDKLICIINCCKIIFSMWSPLVPHVCPAARAHRPRWPSPFTPLRFPSDILRAVEPDKVHGADDFLPCLILLVAKANPPHLHSNLKYGRRAVLQGRWTCRGLTEAVRPHWTSPGSYTKGWGAVCATGAGAHQGQTNREGEKDIWWTARTARGGTGHLGRTETQ